MKTKKPTYRQLKRDLIHREKHYKLLVESNQRLHQKYRDDIASLQKQLADLKASHNERNLQMKERVVSAFCQVTDNLTRMIGGGGF